MGRDSKVTNHPGFNVFSSEWATYKLVLQGHERRVKTFEVTLGEVERAQIGWINEEQWKQNAFSNQEVGVGEVSGTIGFDRCRFGAPSCGEFTKIDGESGSEGTVIRCENLGDKWLVNGKVVSWPGYKINEHCAPIPAVSCNGSWHVSLIEFEF